MSGFLRKRLSRSTLEMGLKVFIPLPFLVLLELPLLFPIDKLVFLKRRNKALGGLLRRMKLKRHYGL